MDGSGSPVAPDLCDAEKMPSESHPDGCIVECPEVEGDQAGPANVTDTETEGDEADESADGATKGPLSSAPSLKKESKSTVIF